MELHSCGNAQSISSQRRGVLAKGCLKNHPFLVPLNGLKCGIMVLYEATTQTKC